MNQNNFRVNRKLRFLFLFDQLLKERICSTRSKVFRFKSIPLFGMVSLPGEAKRKPQKFTKVLHLYKSCGKPDCIHKQLKFNVQCHLEFSLKITCQPRTAKLWFCKVAIQHAAIHVTILSLRIVHIISVQSSTVWHC